MPWKCLSDMDDRELAGASVVVRADLNVPLDGERVADDARIRASIPTLQRLLTAGAGVTVLSHLGRPAGERDDRLTLAPVADRLSELLERPVRLRTDVRRSADRASDGAASPGEIVLLENTRFDAGEEANDAELAERFAALGSVFVNDAFGTAHRAHASTQGLAHAMRAKGGVAVAGLLFERELEVLGEALESPARPFMAILGGAKISGKIDVIDALLDRVDRLLVGGAMANTFLYALGLETGASLVEEDRVETACRVMDRAGDRLLLPVDCIVTGAIEPGSPSRVADRSQVARDDRIADIGPETRTLFAAEVLDARTVLWNGPMGVFEIEPFHEGTVAVARAVADATDAGALTVVGGGDSVAAVDQAGVADRISHVSTGGGASLELIAGKSLPALEALSER